MKHLLSYVMGGCLLASCATTPTSEVSGQLTGLDNDTLFVQSFPFNARSMNDVKLDTVIMQQGKFAFNVGDSVPKKVAIRPCFHPKTNADGSMQAMPMTVVSFVLVPNTPVTVTGTVDDYRLGGAPVYENYMEVMDLMTPYKAQADSIMQIVAGLQQKGASQDSVMAAYEPMTALYDEMEDVRVAYAKDHADKDVAVLLASDVRDQKKQHEVLESITDAVRTGVLSDMYFYLKDRDDKEMARLAAKEKIKEGAEAPDFTAKDIEGKDFTLSSLRGGKYVVLDFWGSWCGWCIKGMPDMKKYYAKYKNKLEIVGVDCNDTEDAWKAAVEKHELPWLHVRNSGDPDLSVLYGIEGYPTKIVLDKDGKIAKVVVGEDPAFYTYLDSILK